MGDLIGNSVNGSLFYIDQDQFKKVQNFNISDIQKAEILSSMCRINTLYMISKAGSGHIGSSFSSMEIFTLLQLSEIPLGNIFFSSKGHDAPALYSVLTALSKLEFQLIHNLRRLNGLPGHPDVSTSEIVTNTGSLGMGISKAKGFILSNRLENIRKYIFVITGDGELQEGQIWESLISSSNFKLEELIVIVDHNKLQSDNLVSRVNNLGNLEYKFESFGWHVERCNGNDIAELSQSIEKCKLISGKPKVIIADTIKGKGVPFMEGSSFDSDVDTYKFHSGAPSNESYKNALDILIETLNLQLSNIGKESIELKMVFSEAINNISNTKLIASYSSAIVEAASINKKIIAFDADLILDTGLIEFQKAFNDRFIECGIAEQDMVSMAGGFALNNFIPIVHSFACFLTSRPLEQIYNNCTENTRIIYVGSLAGIIPAGPGHSHQSVKDIALMSSLPNMTCLEPVSPIQVKESLNWALLNNGPTYLRLTSIPLNFSDSLLSINLPQLGKGNLISQGEDVLLISVGPVLSIEASIAISELVDELNYNVCHVIMPWLNNIDLCWWKELILGKSSILIYENHDLRNGFGEYFKSKIFGNIPNEITIKIFGVSGIPVSGRNHEVLKYYQLDSNSIKNQLLSELDA
jgi:transketolase